MTTVDNIEEDNEEEGEYDLTKYVYFTSTTHQGFLKIILMTVSRGFQSIGSFHAAPSFGSGGPNAAGAK